MQKKFNLGKWLAIIYVVIAIFILLKWQFTPYQEVSGDLIKINKQGVLEAILLMLPLVPILVLNLIFGEKVVNTGFGLPQHVTNIMLVFFNIITWYFIGVWIQWTWTTLWKYKDRKKTKLQLTKFKFIFFSISALVLVAALLFAIGVLLLTLV